MSQNRRERYVARRTNLWKEDNHCRRCGIETLLPDQIMSKYRLLESQKSDFIKLISLEDRNQMATIQHIYDRYHPLRLTVPKNQESRYELWCWKCNNEDSLERSRTQEIRDLQKERSKKVTVTGD